MFKKLLTLAAVAAVGCSFAQADVETVAFKDYTLEPWSGYIMGYIPSFAGEDGMLFEWPHFDYKKVADNPGLEGMGYDVVTLSDGDYYYVPCEDGGLRKAWGIQAFLNLGFDAEIGENYTMIVNAKTDKEDGCTPGFILQWGWGNGESINQSTVISGDDFAEYELKYAEVGGASLSGVLQLYEGDNDAKLWVRWIKVVHEKKAESKPTEWIDWLTNGDAEGEYGEIPCAYSKEYIGRGAAPEYKELADPKPAAIETVDGSKVFVVHAKAVNPDEYPEFFYEEKDGETTLKGDPQWQNQFWIQSPKAWNAGDMFRVSFRYKAAKAAAADTQAHKQTPGDYLHWDLLGGVNFTTDWQNFEKLVTVNDSQDGMWSAAFNLKEYQQDNDYYFDDLKWETMKLDEGFFVAGDFNDWNLGEALEFVYDEDADEYHITVGTDDKPAQEIKVSTVRGNDQAFNAATLSVGDRGKVEDVEDALDYKPIAGVKIKLPEAAVWDIVLDEGYETLQFSINDGGVASVDVDNVAPVYYNLQGIKVANPVEGQVYLVKRGAKVSKVLVR